MSAWLSDLAEQSAYFMPHGHCYLWIPGVLWMHVVSDLLIGAAYVGISIILYVLVRRIRLPFSPIFIAFGLFIGLCGITHFMSIWTVWNPDYLLDGAIKAATAAASVATAIGLFYVKPQVEEVVSAARLSEERRIRLESTHAELQSLYRKVKEMDELKSRLFANISHELRTPLTLILGPAQRMQADANLTDEQRREMELIARNGSSLLKQVNDLLDLAKLEANKMQVRYARLDLVPWFRRIASQFEGVAEQRQIHYRVVAPEALPAEVDPDMLERVFINLLSNAFKFTPQQGEIHASLQHETEAFCFTVTDTGPGVSEDQRQIIFERFRQADSSATRQYGGTGLGLAIVKDFVDLHGGRVEVQRARSGGAEFVVHLPLQAPAGAAIDDAPHALSQMTEVALQGALHELSVPPQEAAAVAQPAMPGLPSVLLVEDTPEMSDFIAGTLRGEFNVVTARDGMEGLERAQALQPDLIVTDIMMPRMSGDQLVTALRERREFDTVPILLLSAKADDALRLQLLQNGAQDYVTKPFSPRELLARAQNLVAMKQAGDILRRGLASASGDVASLARELAVKHSQLQVALEAAEVAREQAERAGEVKSYFLGLISHELRTPLTTIAMSAELLATHAEQLPDALRPRLARLLRASQQMATLVEGLLEYTRAESGRLRAHLQEVDTVAVAQDVVTAHLDHAAPGVQLRFEQPPPGQAPLISDPRLLRVVLSNLVSNALKFTKHGSVTMRLGGAQGEHVFEVEDTGIGIPESDISRIFVPFEQLEPIHRKSIPGVGLGLALVKQIVEILGGKIEVVSKVDAGTTFRVCLPASQYSGAA